ncbi:glycoside hydrolase family 32 protein [Naasia sp. SYSU D00948]|uniref:glycoside hydrolase family 32 protein n=1 Tax=Naasia sp. SYSU D00948 TaxID=2817379 RepID=UPI001B30CAB2|nr:glycoside hydrolase family 32 protein [Naasia sp. SYSU D00948]
MRPRYHFTARSGWINDPHGITYRDGRYEVFFQYVPDSTIWGPNCHWGHARGEDLFSLEELPVALAPGDGDDGIWTGSLALDDAGAATIFYTSTARPDLGMGRIRTATPVDDDWIEWRKGPIVAEAPADLDLVAYRDPFLRRDAATWRMFVGAALTDGTAAGLSYTSPDLATWSYEGIAASRSTHEREPIWTGALWECPQVVDVDGSSVLVSSVWDADALHYAAYGIGTYADGSFRAEHWGRLTYGPSYYAPSFFRDAEGRPCLLFWMRGVSDVEAGWASAHSVPHVLTVTGDRTSAAPHPDLERYRAPEASEGTPLGTAADVVWDPQSDAARLEVRSGGRVRMALTTSPGELTLHSDAGPEAMPFEGGTVRLILDGPVAEVSTSSGLLGVALAAPASDYVVQSSGGLLTAWPLR